MKRTRRDALTGDLFFEIPQPAAPIEGSMDYRSIVTGLVAAMLDEAAKAGMDRYAVAAAVSQLAGKEVSKYMLDAYTAPSREDFNAPAWLMPVVESVCASYRYSHWLATVRGGRLLVGADALHAEMGRLERQRDDAAHRIRALKEQLRRGV